MEETSPVIVGLVEGIAVIGEIDGRIVGIRVGAAVMKISHQQN